MRILAVYLTLLFTGFIYCELLNINPDPFGEPWLTGGVSEPSKEQLDKINALPKLLLPERYKFRKYPLPSSIDNSMLQYFRPVFNQSGGSCGQASGVGYNFTYEINSMRGSAANVPENQYPTHHTYNFLNDGNKENGSWYFDGWDIIQSNGVPNIATYGGLYPDSLTYRHQLWMDGYDKYESGMNNRVEEQFTISVGTPEGLETLKQYFNDYCDGSPTGGIVNFSAGIGGTYLLGLLKTGTPHGGEYAIRRWHTELNHSMTFVGYDDSVRWDYNNDGKFTNNIDLNGDSVIDMKDWEIGALYMVNSYGLDWPNWGLGGKVWVMYRTLALDISEGGIWRNEVHTMRVRDSFDPVIKIKACVSHSNRSKIKIYAGVSSDTTDTVPEKTISFPLFLYQGGSYGMRGDNDTIQFGLDVTPLLSYIDPELPVKFFLCIDENDPANSYSGNIAYFSLIDSDSVETVSDQTNVSVVNNSTTYISLIKSTSFNAPEITISSLSFALQNEYYTKTLSAAGGLAPYKWDLDIKYSEIDNTNSFPYEADSILSVTNNDDGYANIDLGFEFPFYGILYNRITVSTDGSILFGGEFETIRNEAQIIASTAITPYCADLISYTEYGEGVFFNSTDSTVSVRWKTSVYDSSEVNLDFAAKLYKDGKIEFFYGTGLTTGLTWASGISAGNTNSGLISSYSNSFEPSNLKTAFETGSFPYGMTLNQNGVFSGTLTCSPDIWNISFRVTDSKNISDLKELPFSLVSQIGRPDNVMVSAGTGTASITWDPVEGVSLYNIYRCENPYGTYTKIATTDTNSYEDTDAAGTERYFYYVTADNSK